MIKRSVQSVAATWLAGLLVLLPLALTVAVLGWVFSLVYGLVGPGSFAGKFFAALGYPFSSNPGLAYVFGALVLIAAIYLLGLLVQSRLTRPISRLVDRMMRGIPLIGRVYSLADRFVGLLDKKEAADIGAMSPVWCFFGGDGAAVLALAPSPRPIDIDGRGYRRRAGPDRAGAVRRRAALRAGRLGASGEHRGRRADRDLRLDGNDAAAGARQEGDSRP